MGHKMQNIGRRFMMKKPWAEYAISLFVPALALTASH